MRLLPTLFGFAINITIAYPLTILLSSNELRRICSVMLFLWLELFYYKSYNMVTHLGFYFISHLFHRIKNADLHPISSSVLIVRQYGS